MALAPARDLPAGWAVRRAARSAIKRRSSKLERGYFFRICYEKMGDTLKQFPRYARFSVQKIKNMRAKNFDTSRETFRSRVL